MRRAHRLGQYHQNIVVGLYVGVCIPQLPNAEAVPYQVRPESHVQDQYTHHAPAKTCHEASYCCICQYTFFHKGFSQLQGATMVPGP